MHPGYQPCYRLFEFTDLLLPLFDLFFTLLMMFYRWKFQIECILIHYPFLTVSIFWLYLRNIYLSGGRKDSLLYHPLGGMLYNFSVCSRLAF